MASAEEKAQSDLAMMINVSGKLRMLSHRAAMFALLDISVEGCDSNIATNLDRAIAEFDKIVGLLERGGAGLDALVVQAIHDKGAMTPTHKEHLRRFQAMAHALSAPKKAPPEQRAAMLMAFATFVATDLLASLNEINEGVRRALDALVLERKAKENDTRRMVDISISQIEKISHTVRLIALNASVEAARAGENGRGFGVIAAEIQRLSNDTSHSLSDLKSLVVKM